MAQWPTTIRIGAEDLKLLVTSPRGDDQIKARLPLRPPHPRALLTLLKGVALFSGEPLYVVRAIARRLGMARKTVRRILGRSLPQPKAPAAARGSILDAYDATIRSVLRDARDTLARAYCSEQSPLLRTPSVW
jgi:hypothetical protein